MKNRWEVKIILLDTDDDFEYNPSLFITRRGAVHFGRRLRAIFGNGWSRVTISRITE